MADKIAKTLTLSDGRSVEILEGKGRHQVEAARMSAGDPGKHTAALMSLLVRIDGKHVPSEDLEDLSLKEYVELQSAFAEVNF